MGNSCTDCMSGCSASCKDDCTNGCNNTCSDSAMEATGLVNGPSCNGTCAGACNTGCTGFCISCSGSCINTCEGSCTDGCEGACYGTCTNGCKGGCDGCSGCTGCSGDCSNSCSNNCSEGCGDSCSGTCQGCTSCTGNCDGSCLQSCHGTCVNSCTNTCLGTCTTNCQGDCTGCSSTCQTSCTGNCTNDCIGSCIGTCVGSSYVKAPTTYIGNTTNEVVYRRVDELQHITSKFDVNDDDQLIFIQNDAARRIDARTYMEKIADSIIIPYHNVRASLNITSDDGVTKHTDRTLHATLNDITELRNGFPLGVSFTMDYPEFSDDDKPWSLDLILNGGIQTSYNIYYSDGRTVKEQILSESQILDLMFLKDVETDNGVKTGWFIPNLLHVHDERYYTQDEIDEVVTDIDNELELRSLIDRDEMEDLLVKYQEYAGAPICDVGQLPEITTNPTGEPVEYSDVYAMNSLDVGDLLNDLHIPVSFDVHYASMTPEEISQALASDGLAMTNDDAAILLHDIHNS